MLLSACCAQDWNSYYSNYYQGPYGPYGSVTSPYYGMDMRYAGYDLYPTQDFGYDPRYPDVMGWYSAYDPYGNYQGYAGRDANYANGYPSFYNYGGGYNYWPAYDSWPYGVDPYAGGYPYGGGYR